MNPGADDQFFPYEYPRYPPGWIYPLPGPYMFDDQGNPSPSRPRVLTRCQNPSSLEKIAHQPHAIFFVPCIFVSREQEGSGQMQ